MIKDFEEYKVYRSKLLTEGISVEESTNLRNEMDKFRNANPEIFDKLNNAKWSNKGMELLHPDGSVTIMK